MVSPFSPGAMHRPFFPLERYLPLHQIPAFKATRARASITGSRHKYLLPNQRVYPSYCTTTVSLPTPSTGTRYSQASTLIGRSAGVNWSTRHIRASSGKSNDTDMAPGDAYSRAFNNNSTWRRSLAEQEPELFEQLGKGQSPQILWIGCADSRCPETTILGLQPGEIFCHRNIANILVPTDINSLSVIQYAVQYLKVKHIIICGHTSCGGIAAALDNKKLGLIDTWLMPLRALRQRNLSLLETLDEKERGLKLVELNVRSGIEVLHENPIVIDAMSERGLEIHGLIYNVGTGELQELDVKEDDDVVKNRKTAFKTSV